MDTRVGGQRVRGQPLLGGSTVGQTGVEGLHRDLRRHLAGLRAAHAVGDHEQRRARQQRVLVGAPLQAGVGARVMFGHAEHRYDRSVGHQSTSNTNSLSPIRR